MLPAVRFNGLGDNDLAGGGWTATDEKLKETSRVELLDITPV